MNYFKRLGVAIWIDVIALLFIAVFYVLGAFLSLYDGFRIPIFSAFLVTGVIGVGRYMSGYKASVLFDHASLLIGSIKLGLAVMTLIYVRPSNSIFFIIFAFLMVASGMSHFENMMVMQRVKGILWQSTLFISVLVTGIGIVMLVAGPPKDDRARLVYAFCLVVEALASLLEIFLLSKKMTDLHEAALKIADNVKEAIKKDDPPPPAADGKTVVNVLPLQSTSMLTPDDVQKLQKEGQLPGAASALSVSANPADKVTVQGGKKKEGAAEEKKEEKKEKRTLFPDDLV